MLDSEKSKERLILELEELRQRCDAIEQAKLETRRMKEELQEEHNLLRTLIDLLPNPIYVKDKDSRFLVANAAVARFMRVASPNELLGNTDHDFFPSSLADEYRNDERQVMDSCQPLVNKIDRGINPDGTSCVILTTKVPLHDTQGRVIGVVGIGHDITERKSAEEELRRAHDELNHRVDERTAELAQANDFLKNEHRLIHALMDNLPHNIYFKDAASRFIRINKAMAAFFGLRDASEAVGKCDSDFFTSTHAQQAYEDEQEIIRTGRPVLDKEEQETWPDGHISWVLTTKVPLRDDEGHIVGTLGISRDTTERKQVAEALRVAKEVAEAASRAKGAFLANMSHEIRTPLNAIIGMTELVLDGQLTSRQRDFLTTVRESGEALLSIINDILDFSKIEAGKFVLDREPFNLREGLGDTMKLFAVRADKLGLELAINVHKDVPYTVVGDFNRLRQIVVNLVGNALKFTDHGEVVLDVGLESQTEDAQTEDEVRLHFTVSDTGIGIPENKQTAIFEMFEQVDSALTRRHGGTGLGLAIVARLVELMDGRIWVESEPGHGSRFQFTVRFGLSKDKPAGRPEPVSVHGIRVLVVDDNATNRRILDEVLSSWQMAPTSVASGAEAIQAMLQANARAEPYHMVITDLHMPGMDGFMLAEAIRQSFGKGGMAVMMLTSGDRPDDMQRCNELGISAHLLKPVKQSELLEAIEMSLGVARPREDLRQPVEQETDLGSLNILLAEDSLVNQKLAVALLEERGHKVTLARNGREAVEAVCGNTFDMVLMDVQMPEMDGLDATKTIRSRESESGTHVPIVAMTAHALKGDREKCLAAGMDEYITKPIHAAELFKVIHGLFADSTKRERLPRPDSLGRQNVNWDEALRAFDGNARLLQIVVEAVITEIPDLREAIRKAIANGDTKALRLAAHTLKGSMRYFGETAIYDEALRLEKMGQEKNMADAPKSLARLEVECERIMPVFQEFLAGEGLGDDSHD